MKTTKGNSQIECLKELERVKLELRETQNTIMAQNEEIKYLNEYVKTLIHLEEGSTFLMNLNKTAIDELRERFDLMPGFVFQKHQPVELLVGDVCKAIKEPDYLKKRIKIQTN